MKITGLLADGYCPSGPDCPKIYDTDGEEVIVRGDRHELRDPDGNAELKLPEHEAAVLVPRDMIYGQRLTLAEMLDWIVERHTFHLLRVENRRAYAAASDGGDFAAYLAGAPEPQEGSAWHERLRTSTRAGRLWTKLHVIHDDQPSPYEQYELEWGFARTTQAGEIVKILSAEPGDFADVPDFWVIDHEYVVRMTYDEGGKFSHGTPLTGPDAATYRALARAMWSAGTDFDEWWAAHPEAHRHPDAA